MDLRNWLRIVRRWWWLIVFVIFVAAVVLTLLLVLAKPSYKATVKIGLPTLAERHVSSFTQALKADPVRQQVIEQFELTGVLANYPLDVKDLGSAGFLEIGVTTGNPELSALLANTHAELAITYFDELRAQPGKQELEVLNAELQQAKEDLDLAEQEFTDFRLQNGIGSLNDRLGQLERQIVTLQTEYDLLRVAGEPVGEVLEIIADRQEELAWLTSQEPLHNERKEAVSAAQRAYNQILTRLNNAKLSVATAQVTDDVQVIEPAQIPAQPVSFPKRLLVLGFVAAVGLGIGLAFVLDSVFSVREA